MAAVLTGDLIASTQVGQAAVDATMDVLGAIVSGVAEFGSANTLFARFRGDGWQIYSSDPSQVFRLAVLVLANLQCRPSLPKTRISAATGSVSFMPGNELASASGEVFSVSGRNLDSMERLRVVFESNEPNATWKKALFSYLNWQSARWTPEQAESIAMSFRAYPPEPRQSAEELGITRQAFSARLDGAGYVPIWEAESAFRRERAKTL